MSFADLGFAKVDLERDARQGAPEAVLAEGKTPGEIEAIVRALRDGGASSVLVTRADEAARAAVRRVDAAAQEHERARCAWIPVAPLAPAGRVAIVSAGTSDAPAAHEARIRAELCGTHVELHEDCGVAGLDRILSVAPALREADCVIVIAGMDAALASVVGGIVPAPVIAVPTSTGYGASFGGVTALLAMLSSCAAGVACVNIHAGFGAGTIAARIARRAAGAS